MIWIFAVVGLLLVTAIALVVVGRETERLAARPRPAIFDVHEAVDWIADRLSPGAQGRLTHDDVHWILLTDADLIEDVSGDPHEGPYPWSRIEEPEEDPDDPERPTMDEDFAVARLLAEADATGRELVDEDIAEVLEVRTAYLEAIGAIGHLVDDDDGDATGSEPAGSA